MTEDIELNLIVLNQAVHGIDLGQLDVEGEKDPVEAIRDLVPAAASERLVDRFAAAWGFTLGSRLLLEADEPADPLRELAVALLEPYGSSDPDTVDRLIELSMQQSSQEVLNHELLRSLADDLGPALEITSATDTDVVLRGLAAWLVTLLIELARYLPRCNSRQRTLEVGGELKQVTFVEIDACTSQPFDHCRKAIDPRRWPDCNPYFLSVRVLGPGQPPLTGNWAGIVKERVGCPFNGTVYDTDLRLTYVEGPGMAATSFDLAPDRHDDGRVTVDYGFISATDEQIHRRLRVLKVYRIEDLDTPLNWVCPLWAFMVALSAWWCAPTNLSPTEARLVTAWSTLASDGAGALLSHHHDDYWEEVQPATAQAHMSTTFSVPAEACRSAATGVAGEILVGMQPQRQDIPLSPVRVDQIKAGAPPTFGQTTFGTTGDTVLRAGHDSVRVQLQPDLPVGLYLGQVKPKTGGSGSPFGIYLDGL